MEHLSSEMEQQNQDQQLQWRRDKVQELCSKGYSQREISQVLQVGLATVNRDISYLRNQAKDNIKKYIDERLPEEYEKCLVGLTAITRKHGIHQSKQKTKEKRYRHCHWLKECYSMKLDLLTNATVVDDAIKFVSQKSKEELNSESSDSEHHKDESREPDYDEDKHHLEEEQEQEEETGEVTMNKVF
jgi:Trp operon repressor